MSADFEFHCGQWLPAPLSQVFPFFSDPANLDAITPPWLQFKILTKMPLEMKTGAVIDYRLRVHGIPIRWRAEILEWTPPHRFVDLQARGPYRLWRHTHTFAERNGGTQCEDFVRYRPPGGAVADWLLVRRDIKRIFAWRRDELIRRFGAGDAVGV